MRNSIEGYHKLNLKKEKVYFCNCGTCFGSVVVKRRHIFKKHRIYKIMSKSEWEKISPLEHNLMLERARDYNG